MVTLRCPSYLAPATPFFIGPLEFTLQAVYLFNTNATESTLQPHTTFAFKFGYRDEEPVMFAHAVLDGVLAHCIGWLNFNAVPEQYRMQLIRSLFQVGNMDVTISLSSIIEHNGVVKAYHIGFVGDQIVESRVDVTSTMQQETMLRIVEMTWPGLTAGNTAAEALTAQISFKIDTMEYTDKLHYLHYVGWSKDLVPCPYHQNHKSCHADLTRNTTFMFRKTLLSNNFYTFAAKVLKNGKEACTIGWINCDDIPLQLHSYFETGIFQLVVDYDRTITLDHNCRYGGIVTFTKLGHFTVN